MPRHTISITFITKFKSIFRSSKSKNRNTFATKHAPNLQNKTTQTQIIIPSVLSVSFKYTKYPLTSLYSSKENLFRHIFLKSGIIIQSFTFFISWEEFQKINDGIDFYKGIIENSKGKLDYTKMTDKNDGMSLVIF